RFYFFSGGNFSNILSTAPAPICQCYAARRWLVRVCAALRAAWVKPVLPFVCTALSAASWRAAGPRTRAALRACLARLFRDAAEWPSRLRAAETARERVAEGLRLPEAWPFWMSRCAFFRTCAETLPFLGAASFTPERRA